MPDSTNGDLLSAAARGERAAWAALVERFERLVWSVVRGFRLDQATAEDINQTVWLRLLEHCDRIRNPDRLASWLAVTARNEAIRVKRGLQREAPSDFEYDVEDVHEDAPGDQLVRDETRAALLRAFNRLSPDCQELLRLCSTDPPLDYETIASLLDRPIGSIGPTRGRCLERLRRLVEQEERNP